jgi:hypothetical protein
MLVNLRIVMSATAVTILVLLFAFGGVGFLLLARSPQEPIVTKLDLSPPLVAPAKLEPQSQAKIKTIPVPAPVVEAPQSKLDETAAAPPPLKQETVVAPQAKKEEAVAVPQNIAPVPAPEPEITAAIPSTTETKPETVQENATKQRRAPQRVIRRAPPQKKAEQQFTNPFSQLFGGSKK